MRWEWLGLLACEIVLAAVFVVGTIIATRRMNVFVFKNSSWATLLALDEESRRAIHESISGPRDGWPEDRTPVNVRLEGYRLVLDKGIS